MKVKLFAVLYAKLKSFRARAASRRLARLGGSQPDLQPIPRRRPG